MLALFKKLFGKSEPKRVAVPRVVSARASVPSPADPNQPRPQVEVAHLSLAAILGKFPEDLQRSVANLPDASVTVALPLATIHKQLPSGSVKMSLASLYRQAPAGIFAGPARTGDKRMVEVPLSEIFRHVKPQGLRRRNDQRQVEMPADAYELFGDKENPYAIAPAIPEIIPEPEPEYEPEPVVVPEPALQTPRLLKPTIDLSGSPRGADSNSFVAAPPPGVSAPPRVQPKSGITPPSKSSSASSPAGNEPPLLLPIAELCGSWPEPIRAEAMAMEDAQIALPTALITSGLARGKVTFSWGQIRSWLSPLPSSPTQGREATELVLPLKVVAPAFLAHSRPASTRRKIEVDESIPALFSGGDQARPVKPVAAPAAVAAPTSIAAPAALAPPPPASIAPPVSLVPPPGIAVAPSALAAAPAAPAAPAASGAQTIGQLLGKPEKEHWSPPELVKAAVGLPGVSGAVVGLQEGLLVAAELPDAVKGDTVAAFLPQMFARLNNYTGEMKLGEVDELLFTTHDAHFQAYKLGEIYFGVLGNPGEALPWEGLRLIADQLMRQISK